MPTKTENPKKYPKGSKIVAKGRRAGLPWRIVQTAKTSFRAQVALCVKPGGDCAVLGWTRRSKKSATDLILKYIDDTANDWTSPPPGWSWSKWTGLPKRNPSSSSSSSGRELKRGPLKVANLAAVSEHGHVLDLVIDEGKQTRKYRFKRPMPLLLWSPKYKALLFWEDAKLPQRRKVENPDDLPKRAAAAWSKFHKGHEADTARTIKRSEPKTWRRVGRAVAIGYRDPEKWGKDDAEHDFGRGVNVYRAGRLWVVRGGKLRLTAHGIEG